MSWAEKAFSTAMYLPQANFEVHEAQSVEFSKMALASRLHVGYKGVT